MNVSIPLTQHLLHPKEIMILTFNKIWVKTELGAKEWSRPKQLIPKKNLLEFFWSSTLNWREKVLDFKDG